MLRITADGTLACPLCDDEFTHLCRTFVGAREREDGPINEVTVDHDGRVSTQVSTVGPRRTSWTNDRRDRVAVGGWCEGCGGVFAIVFTQHKGVTFVDVVDGKGQPWGHDLDPQLG